MDNIENESIKLSEDLMKLMLKVVKENFVSGIIFDAETNGNREMKIEDLELLDSEVLNKVTTGVLGVIEKKG
jgi:hypothetical protein